MLNKATFADDDELNEFFHTNSINGKSTFYLVKFIVSFNPFTRARELHIVYSSDPIMQGGEHLRKGVVSK
jgi:hypothetical protein